MIDEPLRATPGAACEPSHAGPSVADIELPLLLEATHRRTGHDFREYSPTWVKRRVSERTRGEGVLTLSGLQERILHDESAMARFTYALGVWAQPLFHDPSFFTTLRVAVFPMLRTFPNVRIWVPGCATGADAFALAVLVREAGLHERARIYATEMHPQALERAKSGAIEASELAENAKRYAESGGTATLDAYVERSPNGTLCFNASIRDAIVFAQHNLVTDASFNEFHLIVARGAAGMFTMALSYRVQQLLLDSVVRLGYLALGTRENVMPLPHQRTFEEVDGSTRIYRRRR